MTLKRALFYILFLSFSLLSCRNSENVIYFQGEFLNASTLSHASFLPVIEKNDLLDIKLISQNAEAAELFTPDRKSVV